MSRPRQTTSVRRGVAALVGAAAVNAALLVGLAWLNRTAPVAAEPQAEVTVSVRPEQTDPPARASREPSPTPEPDAAVEPPSMPVEMPEPQVTVVSQVDVDVPLRLPEPAPVRVAVSAARPERSPSAAPTRTQSKAEPTAIRQARPASRGPLSADRVDRPPREKPGNPRPAYPSIAARRGIEGLVRTRLVIDVEGRVQDVEVLDVRGHEQFRQAVVEVARRLRFEPAVHQGRPVAVVATKQFRFKLEDR